MKFIKRLFKLLLVSLLLLVIAVVVLFVRSRQRPDWYLQTLTYDPAQAEAAAQQATQKLQSTWAWAAARQAAEARARAGDATPPATTVPSPVLTVSFTEQELNAFFQRWKEQQGWERLYSRYVTNPAIVLRDGRIILAGTATELNRVVSFHFRPQLDQAGNTLRLELESVMAGKLPMPQALFERYRQELSQRLAEHRPDYQREAQLRPDGSVNSAAMDAAMIELLVSVLDRKPVEPVLFLTGNLVPGGDPRMVPVRLVNAKVDDGNITMGVEMMAAPQRQAWIQRVRGPFAAASR